MFSYLVHFHINLWTYSRTQFRCCVSFIINICGEQMTLKGLVSVDMITVKPWRPMSLSPWSKNSSLGDSGCCQCVRKVSIIPIASAASPSQTTAVRDCCLQRPTWGDELTHLPVLTVDIQHIEAPGYLTPPSMHIWSTQSKLRMCYSCLSFFLNFQWLPTPRFTSPAAWVTDAVGIFNLYKPI